MRKLSLPVLLGLGILTVVSGIGIRTGRAAEKELPLVFSGGHEIGTNDFGRPVVLIAAALGVKPDEFRKAFSRVTPAKGRPPSGSEARKNKEALLKVLGPLGVTNDRLDEVSDYYRYQPQKGELWKTAPAKGRAVIEDGKVTKIIISDAGSGYSSRPQVTIQGMENLTLKCTLHLDQDVRKNGSVESIDVADARKPGR